MKAVFLLLLIFPFSVLAEDLPDAPPRTLPGERVKPPHGKAMNVWSTRGPVAVSPAPEPFQNDSSETLPPVHIIVDEKGDHKKPHRQNRPSSEQNTLDAWDRRY